MAYDARGSIFDAATNAGKQIGSIVRMSYKPKPIETSGVELAPELMQLTERLAENTYDLFCSTNGCLSV